MKEKVRINDFSKKELPNNRRELFRDILFNHTFSVVNTSLLTTLFFIPLIAVFIVFYNMLANASNNSEPFNVLFSLLFYGSLIAIPALILAFLGVSAAYGVAKRLAWGEGLMLLVHFFSALKSELKKTFLMSIIIALSTFALVVGGVYLSTFYVNAPVATGIGIGILVVQFLLVVMSGCYFFAYIHVYQNTFGQALKNCFLIATVRLPISLLFIIISPGIVLALVAVHYIAACIAIFFFVIFSFVGIFLWTLLSHSSFDKFINQEHHPAYVKRGLYVEQIKKEEEVG